jgi:hypothetical protein
LAYSKSRPIEERRSLLHNNSKRYNERHPEQRKETLKKYNESHREKHARDQIEWRRKLKERDPEKWDEWRKRKNQRNNEIRRQMHREIIERYGGKCYCCGESILTFLALDHINGGGSKHRKELRGKRIETWAKENGWPGIFRVACHNCNFGAHLNGGICPHQSNEIGG